MTKIELQQANIRLAADNAALRTKYSVALAQLEARSVPSTPYVAPRAAYQARIVPTVDGWDVMHERHVLSSHRSFVSAREALMAERVAPRTAYDVLSTDETGKYVLA